MRKRIRPKLFLGIDPGRSGAICAYDGEDIVFCEMLPFLDKKFDVQQFRTYLDSIKAMGSISHCLIEHQQSMGPPTSPRSAFTAGEGYGALKAAIQCSDIPMETIRPNAWKRDIAVSRAKKKGESAASHRRSLKAIAKRKAVVLAPNYDFRISTKGRVPHDGKCEAFLLAVVSFRNNRR